MLAGHALGCEIEQCTEPLIPYVGTHEYALPLQLIDQFKRTPEDCCTGENVFTMSQLSHANWTASLRCLGGATSAHAPRMPGLLQKL